VALFSSSNVTTGTTTAQCEIVYNLTVAALLAGWTIQSYGTGTSGSYSSSGTGFVLASMTANSTRNWYRMRAPTGTQELTFQIIDNAGRYRARIKASLLGFSGGSPSANTTPSATDEVVVFGSGTDASPGNDAWSAGYPTAHKTHAVADSTPISGIYPLACYSYLAGTATFSSWFLQDPMLPGSFDPADSAPVVWTAGIGNTTTFRWWHAYGTGSAAQKSMVMPTTQLVWDGTRGVDPVSGNDSAGRLLYYPAAPDKEKGFSSWLLMKGQSRAFPNNINKATAAYTYMGSTAAGILLRSMDNLDLTL
jgi:hypothetical protein